MFAFPIYSRTTFKNIKKNKPVIIFYVNVPVLSEHMLLAPPMISHAANVFTKFYSSFILLTENAKVIVTANGNPLNNHYAKYPYLRHSYNNNSNSYHKCIQYVLQSL